MKLIEATVARQPRQVSTKYGDRVVLECITNEGEEITIWRNGNDTEALGRYPSERVTLAVDSKGKYSLIEHAGSKLDTAAATTPNSRADEIRDYTQRLAKLYAHCYRTVNSELGDAGLPVASLKDVATTLFIQTTRKFDL